MLKIDNYLNKCSIPFISSQKVASELYKNRVKDCDNKNISNNPISFPKNI